jgi:hypothetical protein
MVCIHLERLLWARLFVCDCCNARVLKPTWNLLKFYFGMFNEKTSPDNLRTQPNIAEVTTNTHNEAARYKHAVITWQLHCAHLTSTAVCSWREKKRQSTASQKAGRGPEGRGRPAQNSYALRCGCIRSAAATERNRSRATDKRGVRIEYLRNMRGGGRCWALCRCGGGSSGGGWGSHRRGSGSGGCLEQRGVARLKRSMRDGEVRWGGGGGGGRMFTSRNRGQHVAFEQTALQTGYRCKGLGFAVRDIRRAHAP